MGEKDADLEMVKMLSVIVSKGKKQAEEAEQQARETRAEIEALQSQPNGDHRQKQIRERAEAFLAQPNRADREVRNAFNDWVKTTGARIIFMSTQPLRLRFTCSDLLPTDFRWLSSSKTEEQVKNHLEEFYVFRRGDEIVMDQEITNMARLGFDPEVITAQRRKKEASISVPKRIPSPVWLPAAPTKRQHQMQQQQ